MKKLITILITALLIAAFGCQKKAIPVKDRYTQINIGAPDAGAGDNLYTAFTKVNANFAAVDDSLELKAPIANPNFTGVARLNTTDTLATQAYARAEGGGSSEGEGVWGGITGTLSDQTDLQSALNAKAPTVSPTFTTSATLPAATSIGSVSSTEIGYVDGARENIQDQLDDTTSVDNLFSGILNVLEYGAISNDGNSDTAAINTAIRAARNAGGTWGDEAIVWIPPGIYNIDGGLTMYSRVSLMIAKNAVMYVSSGYEGACIIFPDDAYEEDFLVQGGFFIEQNPKQYKWTGVQMYKTDGVTTSYSTFGEMIDVTFFGCGIGIDIYLE
ncbi:MAG: glycosyl hydrolase family 28-related protein, partial [Synergistaceae bacterium]